MAENSEFKSELSFGEQIRSFNAVYWLANWMELVERFAYYGVRVVLPVFMVAAVESGGPQFSHIQKGTIYAIWALVQSFLPIFSGGFADRYGYKINIAISTLMKIAGYVLMGYCIVLAEMLAGQSLAIARAAGTDKTYEIFFAGAMLLAAGTAIFKPGVQGLIANQLDRSTGSVGWAIFYQMVNIGGFIGPLLAGYLRILDWEYVFLACSFGIALNFIPLFFFKEPAHAGSHDDRGPWQLLVDAVRGLLEPRLFFFTIAFAGFWLMFYQLFDILPNFIDDWVDSRGVANALESIFGSAAVPTINGGNLTQEWIININALMISIFAFAAGHVTGRFHSLKAIVFGIAISAVGIYALGFTMNGWITVLAICIFSIGEMSASPTKMRYLADIAPRGKQGLYMGYANFTVGIGWSIGSIIAGEMYQNSGDKIILARRYLVEQAGVAKAKVDALGRADVMEFFRQQLNVDPWQARDLLWHTYEPYGMWIVFMLIGLASMILIVLYDRVTSAADANPEHSFNQKGQVWVRFALIPIIGAFALALVFDPGNLAIWVQFVMFSLLMAASFKRGETATP